MAIRIRFQDLKQKHERATGGYRITLKQIERDTGLPYVTSLANWYGAPV